MGDSRGLANGTNYRGFRLIEGDFSEVLLYSNCLERFRVQKWAQSTELKK